MYLEGQDPVPIYTGWLVNRCAAQAVNFFSIKKLVDRAACVSVAKSERKGSAHARLGVNAAGREA